MRALWLTLSFMVLVLAGPMGLVEEYVRTFQVPEPETSCVPEGQENEPGIPPSSVGCKCFQITKCEGGETDQCKRHCKKDQCQCCSI